jgi:Zn-dependent protease
LAGFFFGLRDDSCPLAPAILRHRRKGEVMLAWWVAEAWQASPVLLVSWVVWVIGSIVLHELAHGWTAIRCGDRTPIETGHMTWNPLVHMGEMSLLMFAAVGIAWGAMPVNPANFRGRYDDAKVAIAGPMMNLLLFLIALSGTVAVVVLGARLGDPLRENLFVFARTGAFLNLALLLFNLIPAPPLDGYRILADFVPAFRRLWESPNAPLISMGIFIAVFWFGGPWAFSTARDFTDEAIRIVLGLLGYRAAVP